jgi:hypothetical protein
VRILRLPVCSTIPIFNDLRLLQEPLEQLSSGSAAAQPNGKGGLMRTDTPAKKAENSMLEKLADRVQELYLKAQEALPVDRARINALYREAYLAHRAYKIFVIEQDALSLTTAR